MKKYEFLEIYKKLNDEDKEKIDEKIIQIEERQQLIANLDETLKKLSSKEMEDVLKEQDEFLEESDAEYKEIEGRIYHHDDDGFLYKTEMEEYFDIRRERLINNYPIGIDVLEDEIESIENEIFKLIPDY